MQVQWVSPLTTQMPSGDAEVARWITAERPDCLRRLGQPSHAPTAEQVLAFMRRQPHFANMAAGLYAQAHGLLPDQAHIPAACPPEPNATLNSAAPARARSGS